MTTPTLSPNAEIVWHLAKNQTTPFKGVIIIPGGLFLTLDQQDMDALAAHYA